MHLFKALAPIVAALAIIACPAGAQVRTVDPNSAIDADLAPRAQAAPPVQQAAPEERVDPGTDAPPPPAAPLPAATASSQTGLADHAAAADTRGTYHRDDLIGAAEGVFGKGAKGLAEIIEKLLKDQGEPNAYIAGREASGAFVVGLRYGSGVVTQRVEGERKVYWTGPSLGFDVGGDANKVFVLVYNLYDTQDLYRRFPAAEGRVFFIGGFAAQYLRRGDIVMIPIRLGVGWRLGANIGYMKFSEKAKWLPF